MIRVTVWSTSSDVCNRISGMIDDRLARIRGLRDDAMSAEERVLREAEVSLIVHPSIDREEYEYRYTMIVITSDYKAEGKTILSREIAHRLIGDGMRVFSEDELSDRGLREMRPRERERRQKNLSRCDVHIAVHQSYGGIDPKHTARWAIVRKRSGMR